MGITTGFFINNYSPLYIMSPVDFEAQYCYSPDVRRGRSGEDDIGLQTATSVCALFWESPCPERGLAGSRPHSKLRLRQRTGESSPQKKPSKN
ncbi:hypothetical protein NPIL_303621 [Nephila pilipes]|uniref:Uncharacterized protein n=1 Tax=Nephila pilipes TaxID=299642 RepID=A0A8X6QFM4_NEPPI|nr:hypothetical protein NPIL_303621 [Nephila pilipes]